MKEDDPRLLPRHVVMDRDHLDAASPQRLQDRLQLAFDHREVAVCEVAHPRDAIDHGEPEGQQRVDAADRKSLQSDLYDGPHAIRATR